MGTENTLTMQEVQERMKYLREVFEVVRLVDASSFQELTDDGMSKNCQCYSFWKRNHKCENCVSEYAIKEKAQKIKLEIIDSCIYQVIARYLVIDGREYSLEMLKRLDKEMMINSEECEAILSDMSGYTRKLYEDVLTKVYNRRYFEDKFRNISFNCGIAIIDLDDFKNYNDKYGHNAGDAILTHTARVIQENIRKTDSVIRYGGDEFLIILPDIDSKIMTEKLQQIQREINNEIIPEYEKIRISTSIGGVHTEDDETVGMAVSRADEYMYAAKKRKNTVVTDYNIKQFNTELDSDDMKPLILIIDDSDINRGILADILKNDYRIAEAAGGKEGLDMIDKYDREIAMVLLDIIMPEVDGYEVLRVMKEKEMLEDTPVVIISTDNSDQAVKRSYDMGATDYIARPFDARVVYRRVNNIVKLYLKQRKLLELLANS